MKSDVTAVRKCLKSFDFPTLFREHLGWDNHQTRLEIPVGDGTVQLTAVAQKRGFVAYVCSCGADGQPCEVRESAAEDGAAPLGQIPDRATRLKIDQQVTKSAREHFVIYADQRTGQQVWHWVRREPGRPSGMASPAIMTASTTGITNRWPNRACCPPRSRRASTM